MGIVAVLTGMAAFNFKLARIRSRDMQRKNDVNQMQKALEVYKNDLGLYPAGNYDSVVSTMLTQKYLSKKFVDPKGVGDWLGYTYLNIDSKNYYLMTCLENSADLARATSDELCKLFTAEVSIPCRCGHYSSSRTGIMYIINQP
jgi:hypothetical protein